VVTEVPAGTTLQVEWDKPERVQLGEVERIEAVTRYGIHLVKHGYKAKIFALVPGKQKATQLWLRIGVPTGNRAWVRSEAVTLLPGADWSEPPDAPVLIPVRGAQLPVLREAHLPMRFFTIFFAQRSAARMTLRVILQPDGRVKQANLVQSAGHPEADEVIMESVRGFRFDPVSVDGEPAFALLLLQVELMAVVR